MRYTCYLTSSPDGNITNIYANTFELKDIEAGELHGMVTILENLIRYNPQIGLVILPEIGE